MMAVGVVLQFFLLVGARVTAVSSVNALELDAVDAAFETELRDVNQFEATSPEGLVILNMDPLGKSRHFEAESTGELHTKQVPVVYLVAGDAATLPHSELKIMWKKSRPARQVSLQSNVAVGKSTDQSYVEANDLVNQLSNDDITVESDGSGDNQFESLPEMSLTPAMPRLQQGDIHLTPESGYSPSSTLPKIPKSPATIENAQKKTTDGLPNTDKTEGETMGAISAEERESSDTSLSSAVEDNGKNSTIPEDVETKEMNSSSESRSNERTTTVVTSSEDQEIFVSDDTLEISDQPESRLPSGRSLDEASIIPVNLGKVSNETSLNVKSSQTKKFFEKPIISKEDSRYSKNVTTLAISPKNSPTSGTTFPLFGNGKMVRVMKENIAVILGVILGLPVFVSTCYLLNHRRSRTGSMDITPATSESAKKKMSAADDSRRTVTCSIENELSSCPCEA